jgi:hypothetical protein
VILPVIASILGMPTEALYERQRTLVRLGLLESKEGRGPGSGVRLSAESVGVLIASILVADHPSELNEKVSNLLKLKVHSGRCPLTNAETLGGAVDTCAVVGMQPLIGGKFHLCDVARPSSVRPR